jgi:ankyrin repeat protein
MLTTISGGISINLIVKVTQLFSVRTQCRNLLQKRTMASVPLVVACLKGQFDVVCLLVQDPKTDPNQTLPGRGGGRGKTPLYIACYYNHIAIAQALLALDTIDIDQGDPLQVACEKGHTQIVWLLVQTTELTSRSMKAGLRSAASWGHFDIVALLMVQGADAGGTDHNPRLRARTLAEMGHHTAICTFLEAVALSRG